MGPSESLTFNLIFTGLAVVVGVLGVPLILGKAKPNAIYGFRTPRTLSSPAIWYPANRAAGWALALSGAGMMVFCTLATFFADRFLGPNRGWLASGTAFVVAMIATLAYSLWYANKLPSAAPGTEPVSDEERAVWGARLDKLANRFFALEGLLCVGLAIPFILGEVPFNSTYGFHTYSSLRSTASWFVTNEASGWGLAIAGLAIFVVSGALLLLGERLARPGRGWWVGGVVFLLALGGAVGHGFYALTSL